MIKFDKIVKTINNAFTTILPRVIIHGFFINIIFYLIGYEVSLINVIGFGMVWWYLTVELPPLLMKYRIILKGG